MKSNFKVDNFIVLLFSLKYLSYIDTYYEFKDKTITANQYVHKYVTIEIYTCSCKVPLSLELQYIPFPLRQIIDVFLGKVPEYPWKFVYQNAVGSFKFTKLSLCLKKYTL